MNGNERKIEQITRLLFLKAFDAKETEWDLRPDCKGTLSAIGTGSNRYLLSRAPSNAKKSLKNTYIWVKCRILGKKNPKPNPNSI